MSLAPADLRIYLIVVLLQLLMLVLVFEIALLLKDLEVVYCIFVVLLAVFLVAAAM